MNIFLLEMKVDIGKKNKKYIIGPTARIPPGPVRLGYNELRIIMNKLWRILSPTSKWRWRKAYKRMSAVSKYVPIDTVELIIFHIY